MFAMLQQAKDYNDEKKQKLDRLQLINIDS